MPGYQAPTQSSLAHRAGPVPGDDVEMSESTPLPVPATGDQDQDMADIPPVHPAIVPTSVAPTPTPTSAAPVTASSASVPASADQTIQVSSLLENLPSATLSRGELTRLKLAAIRTKAEAAKRRRTESTDDTAENQPSAAKKHQTEQPQQSAVVRQSFPYQEVAKLKRTFCCLRVNGGQIIGGLQKQNGFGIKFSMDPGAQGMHAFFLELMCNVVDKSVPLLDDTPTPDMVDIVPMAWYTGSRVNPDSDEGPYQLEDFEIFCAQDHPAHQAANDSSVLQICPQGKSKFVTYCRFKSNMAYFTDQTSGGKVWKGVDQAVVDPLKTMMTTTGNYVELWFLHSFGGSNLMEANILGYFRRAYDERLPVLSQYDVLHLDGTPSIKDIGQGMYCKYPMKSVTGSKTKEEDRSDGPIGFSELPIPKAYNFRRDFAIHNALLPIREYQFQKGLVVNVQATAVRVYLMSLTGIEIKDRSQFGTMTPEQQRVHKTFYAFVRMPGQKGQKELTPAPGLRVSLEWDNSDPKRHKAHAPVKNAYQWKGIIVAHQGAAVNATGTDYCVLVTMPKTIPRVPFRPFSEAKYLPNAQLPLAHLKVKYSNLTQQRELDAWLAFCNSTKPHLIAMQSVLRSNAIINEDDVAWVEVASGPNNTSESKHAYFEMVERFERDNALDSSQIQALTEAARSPLGTTILQGPPGTGKTWTASHLTWALVAAGHKVLFVAPTNVAVDGATTTIMRTRPADMAHHKVIRLEATSVSMGEITKFIDYEEMEQDQPGILKPLPASEDDPVLQQFIEEFEATLDVQADVDFEKLEAETRNFSKAYEIALNAYKDRAQDFPVESSLDFNVWRTCKEDYERAATRARRAQLETPHNVTEIIAPQKTESSEYAKAVQDYIHLQGKRSSAAGKAFLKLRVQQEARNISDATVICTTASNAAADILAAKFNPTVIIIDEVGQMTGPALAVPLLAFKHWVTTYLIGDPQQLQPLLTALRFCEVRGIVQLSVLGTYITRGYPLLFLEIQYRMDPEIALWPNQIFYEGRLRNAVSTEIDNAYKQAIRRVTSKYYGIKGEHGNGSLYMMVDVIHGRARLEEGGTSLQNYANADAIVKAIGHLIDEGFPRSEIKLLTLYKGQKTVLISKLAEDNEGNHWVPEDVVTVDSYQGRQGVFACLDMVAASRIDEGKFPAAFNEDADAADGAFLNIEKASAYVTNPHRLCVGVTRTTCGLFTFCQTATLARAYKPNRVEYQNAAFRMVEDAQERGVIYRDTEHFDTHPAALREVANIDALNARMKAQDDAQFDFVQRVTRKAQSQRHVQEQKRTAIKKIPAPKREAPPSRRAPHVLPERPTTLNPESAATRPDTDEGSVPVTARPLSQREQKREKKTMKDKLLATQLAEEEKSEKKKPEVIPNPGFNLAPLKNWADEVGDEKSGELPKEGEATKEPTE